MHNPTKEQRSKCRDLRDGTKKKKVKRFPKPWIVLFMMLLSFLILSGIAIGFYFLIRTTTKPSHSLTRSAVLRWNATGVTVAGMTGLRGKTANQLDQPIDIAIPSFNTLYVLEYNNHRLQKWTVGALSGETVGGHANASQGNQSFSLRNPLGLYVDPDENIYIADGGNNRVQYYAKGSSNGWTIAGMGSSTSYRLNNPYGIALDLKTKTVYVADYNHHRIISYSPGASVGKLVAGGNTSGITTTLLSHPARVHFDSDTNSLLITNLGVNSIVRWIIGANHWSLVAGSGNGSFGNSSRLLYLPMSVTMDPMGNIYVADGLNHRIQWFESGQGEGRTIAGVTGVSGSNASLLSYPYSVRLDSQLNVYVADTMNHRVQKFHRY